jgi:Predicted RNA polymerase sigma factor containing a TPR repeat domain
VQAAIASLHADEPRDWPQIAALYGELARLTESPVVELSRAVAVAEALGPEQGLDIVDRLALEDYHYLHSTRGELLRRLVGLSKRGTRTAGRSLSFTTTRSGACSSAGSRSSKRRPAPPAEPTDQSVLAAGSDSQPPAGRREDREDERDRECRTRGPAGTSTVG